METISITKICRVDTDNRFVFEDYLFEISSDVNQYSVENKPIIQNGKIMNDYTNYSRMSNVKVVMVSEEPIKFYDEDENLIDQDKITIIYGEE